MAKTIVCRCEDVCIEDLKLGFEQGLRELEELKRHTGLATGFCQGKCCIAHAARFLARLKGGDDMVADPPRTRPLLHPTPVYRLAGELEAEPEGDGEP